MRSQKEPNPEQEKNMSVRLDAETKEFLSNVALALNKKEKDIAIEAIQEYCHKHIEAVQKRISELKEKYDALKS